MRNSPLLIAILAALPACETTVEGTGCMGVPDDQTTCPSNPDPDKLLYIDQCGEIEVTEVTGPGQLREQWGQVAGRGCCYPVEAIDHDPSAHCEFGRPYFDDAMRRLSAPVEASTETQLSAQAEAWAQAGAAEHASIAAFARLALQLLALGAPTELVADVQRAAIDEIKHAEQCFALARLYGAPTLKAGAFPFGDNISMKITLSELAEAAVREGCLAETLCAHVTTVAAELTGDARIKPDLTSIAAEEATHAVLSFRIVAWAIQAGGGEVRRAVQRAFDAGFPHIDFSELALRTSLPPALLQRAATEGVEHVLRPAAARLLAA